MHTNIPKAPHTIPMVFIIAGEKRTTFHFARQMLENDEDSPGITEEKYTLSQNAST